MVSGIPPFERFYECHKGEVLAFLRRRAGQDGADDLFQETFLRALRAYGRLEHGDHLRAWVLTIAANAVVDAARRERPTTELALEPASEDDRPAVEELAPLTDDLPPKERAAVVLRYGYDLDYDDDRRRARLERAGGATSGLRRRAAAAEGEGAAMTEVPTLLDERFRAAAAASGELDVAYDVLDDTPVGPLLVGVSERGLCRIGFDPQPEARARAARPALRPARLARARARSTASGGSWTSTSRDAGTPSTSTSIFARRRSSTGASSRSSTRVEYGHTTTYGTLAAQVGAPRAARAVGTVMNRNPLPIVLPCHRVVGANGSLTGYGGGLDRKEWLLRLEGALL